MGVASVGRMNPIRSSSNGAPPAPEPARVPAFYGPVFWALAAVVVVAHVLGAGPFTSALWGSNPYGFLPRLVLPVACAILAGGFLAAYRASGAAWLTPARLRTVASPGPLLGALAVAGFFAAFWVFREGHTLLGDGSPLTRSLPLGQRFHPYQPLTFLIHHWFYSLTHGLFAAAGTDPREVARSSVALSSALAGALF